MAIEMFHDQVSKKECAGHGNRTRACLLPSEHISDRAAAPGRPERV